jgi:hypothetical protein
MLGWIIQKSIVFIIFIFILHSLFQWFIDTLTLPKTKDFVDFPAGKYEKIYDILKTSANTSYNENVGGTTPLKSLPNVPNDNSMKDELINFLNSK